ncbi:VanZ family protein [Confluentibacter sediminis]|uniref:VanZ family protein n=1 Tax=Confluentibacter sediminis TaxID=2219045 RepID=UPI0034DB3884
MNGLKIVLKVFSIVYFLVLFYLVFFLKIRFTTHYNGSLQIIPFKRYMLLLQNSSLKDFIQNTNMIEPFANLLLFLPFTSALKHLTGLDFKFKECLYIVLLSSFSIESIQYVCHIGVADSSDIILNSLGGLIIPSLLYFKILHFKPKV